MQASIGDTSAGIRVDKRPQYYQLIQGILKIPRSFKGRQKVLLESSVGERNKLKVASSHSFLSHPEMPPSCDIRFQFRRDDPGNTG